MKYWVLVGFLSHIHTHTHVLHTVHAPGNILREGVGFRFGCIPAGSSLESLWPRPLCKRISGHSVRRGQDECAESSATRRTQYNRGLSTIARQNMTGNFHRVLSARMRLSSRTHAWNWCSATSPCPNNLFSHFVPATNLFNSENTRYEFSVFVKILFIRKNFTIYKILIKLFDELSLHNALCVLRIIIRRRALAENLK